MLALATGWTMDELRAHSIGDLSALAEALEDRARVARMRQARGGA